MTMVVATIGKILSGPSIRKVRFEKLPTGKPPGWVLSAIRRKILRAKSNLPGNSTRGD